MYTAQVHDVVTYSLNMRTQQNSIVSIGLNVSGSNSEIGVQAFYSAAPPQSMVIYLMSKNGHDNVLTIEFGVLVFGYFTLNLYLSLPALS